MSTVLGPDGAPRTTPFWVLFEHGHLRFSLVEVAVKYAGTHADVEQPGRGASSLRWRRGG